MRAALDSSLVEHAIIMLAEGRALFIKSQAKINKKKSNYRIILAASFSRIIEMSNSFMMLLQNNRVPDAGIVLRSIFNLFVSIAFIKEEPIERSLAFMLDGTERHIDILKKLQAGVSPNNENHKKQLAYEEKQRVGIIEELTKIDPNFVRWKTKNIYQRACTWQAIKEYYLLYSELSRYEHNDYSALCAYVDEKTLNPILEPTSHFYAPAMSSDNLLILWLPIFDEFLQFFNDEYRLGHNLIIDKLRNRSLSYAIS